MRRVGWWYEEVGEAGGEADEVDAATGSAEWWLLSSRQVQGRPGWATRALHQIQSAPAGGSTVQCSAPPCGSGRNS